MAGDSSAAGVGARTQREALAHPLAALLAQRLGGVVRWQLVAESGLTSEGVLHRLVRSRPHAADIAVIVVEVNDITKDVPLAFALDSGSTSRTGSTSTPAYATSSFRRCPKWSSSPPCRSRWRGMRARRRDATIAAQARWAARTPGVSHVIMDGVADPRLFCKDGFHPAPALYARVAERLTDHIVEVACATEAPKLTTEKP